MKKVEAYKQNLVIPIYELDQSEINPVFFEKRDYQGSWGKVYPVPFIDKVYYRKVDKNYEAEILGNEFVKLVLNGLDEAADYLVTGGKEGFTAS